MDVPLRCRVERDHTFGSRHRWPILDDAQSACRGNDLRRFNPLFIVDSSAPARTGRAHSERDAMAAHSAGPAGCVVRLSSDSADATDYG